MAFNTGCTRLCAARCATRSRAPVHSGVAACHLSPLARADDSNARTDRAPEPGAARGALGAVEREAAFVGVAAGERRAALAPAALVPRAEVAQPPSVLVSSPDMVATVASRSDTRVPSFLIGGAITCAWILPLLVLCGTDTMAEAHEDRRRYRGPPRFA